VLTGSLLGEKIVYFIQHMGKTKDCPMFQTYNALIALLSCSVFIAYLNHRFTQMQPTIAIMMASLSLSALLIFMQKTGIISIENQAKLWIASIDFHALVIDGLLGYLLFAGALHVDLSSFRKYKWQIGTLSCISTLLSTLITAWLLYYLASALYQPIPMSLCLLFGALISPTDPIAVLSLLKQMKAPRDIQAKMAGESLFNDGIGIVLFSSIYALHFHHSTLSLLSVSTLFIQQAIGGIVYGLILGKIGHFLIQKANDEKLSIMITLVITSGGYALAQQWLLISGPLSMVTAGMFIANHKDKGCYSRQSIQSLDFFWELIDELLNAILFLLLGLELLVLDFNFLSMSLMLLSILLVLSVRFFTVAIPMSFFRQTRKRHFRSIPILVWGGLRGGLAVALVMTLPDIPERNLLLGITYVIVLFSILVQGSTIKHLIKKLNL
jgi:monovalent cation:H+ antiporter, CPA1 family